jgi:ABC-type lipoprotein export system ATPase subunit
MIRISDLEFQYRQSDFRLCVPRLSVAKGETVAMIGPSGSGKTTLLNLIAGILVPSAGRVVTNQAEVSSLGESARRDFRIRHVGLVFQEFELLEHLNVLDNILLACRITSSIRIGQTHRDRAVGLAGEMGIDDKLRRFVRQLSQGERQRVALCRALLLEPPLLLCDEPTGNLDPANKEHVLDILFEYVRRNDTTLLTVTHDHELLPRFDDTVDVKRFHDAGEAHD